MTPYPGRIVAQGDGDAATVRLIEAQLASRGYARTASGIYDAPLAAIVSLFQSQNVDPIGRPLKIDGKVGPNSWAALFRTPAAATTLLGKIVQIAESQIGVMEIPPGSNAGPQVEAFLASVGCPKGLSWCMAFVHWCVEKASGPGSCPAPRSGGVLDVLHQTRQTHPARFIAKAAIIANPALVTPGWVFIQDHGHGLGHTGIVKDSSGGGLVTIEGNTNTGLSREGLGVFQLNRRSITDDQLVGFIDYSKS